MNYQLNRDGLMLGEFTTDELRRGRADGQFDGRELVWGAGMAQWQPLEDFLREKFPPTLPPPIPISPEQKRNRLVAWVVVGVAVLFLGGMVLVGFGVVKFVQQVRQYSRGVDRPEAQAAANQPVIVPADSITQSEQRVRQREFRVRQWIEGYEQNGDHAAAGDADVRRLLEIWIEKNYGDGRATNAVTARELGDQLAATPGGEDPMMLTVAAVETAELNESIARLERAVENFASSRHRAYPKFYATVLLADKLGDRSERRAALDEAATAHLRAAFTDGSLTPEDSDLIADILIFGWGKEFFGRNAGVVSLLIPPERTHPSQEWLALVLAGEFQIKEAWKARGGGYADSVTADGWRKFQNHLAVARKDLTKAWTMRPDLPLAASRMIYVALGDSGITEMRQWFDRAVTAQIDYPNAWSSLRWGLRPRWYGDWNSMRDFGFTALNTGRFDTDVPRKLFDSIADLEAEMELSLREHIYGNDDVWPGLRRMYEGYIAEPTQAAARDGWRSTYAVVAYLAGQPEVARAQFEALDWKPRAGNFQNWRTDLSLLPLEVAALTGPLAVEVQAAEELREEQEFADALLAYQQLAKDARADERTRAFVAHRVATLEIETAVERGEWVNFLPGQENDPAWNAQAGGYRPAAAGGVEVSAGQHGHLIVCRARVGPEFEVRGEFEVVHSTSADFQAGLVMGMPDATNADWLAFRIKSNAREGRVASYSRGWTTRQVRRAAELSATTNSFHFRFRNSHVESFVNGQPVHVDTHQPAAVRYEAGEFLVGLGAFNDANETVIRYHHVQFRRLPDVNSPAQD